MYLCAMCRPAAAITGVLNPSGQRGTSAAAARAAMDVALRVGADDHRHGEVNQALRRISRDAEQGRERGITFAADGENLVWDLAGALESRFGGRRVLAVRDPSQSRLLARLDPPVDISLDGVSGAVQGLFADMPPLDDVTDDQVAIVTGALVIAMTVADDADQPNWPLEVPSSSVKIRPPRAVSHPILLSPEAWLVATAYHLS